MKTYKLEGKFYYEVEAENEEEAMTNLENRFAIENNTAENEFWGGLEISKIEDE